MKKIFGILILFIANYSVQAQCWKTVGAGISHTIALRPDGTLWAWGFNGSGQLGDGTLVIRGIPVQIGTDSDWKSIAVGGNQSFAVKNDGTLWAWGDNFWGQLGVGQFGNTKNIPTKVGSDTDWKYVSAGRTFTLAIKNNGALWAWGDNMFGALGISTTGVYSPAQVGIGTDWQQVSAGGIHTLAIKTDGSLWGWGSNIWGGVGDGTTSNRNTPAKISTTSDWKNVTAGYGTSHAIKTDGTRWAWGNNDNGEMGDGTYVSTSIPTQVGADNTWKNISGGLNSSIGIKTDGTIWAWGRIIGTYISNLNRRNIPAQIGSSTGWQWQTSGDVHAFALRDDGTLWAWGENSWSKLGDNTMIDNPDPAIISSPTPQGVSIQPFCSAATVANLTAIGTTVKWYATASGGAPLQATTALVNGDHYYASQSLGGCESAQRLDVQVIVNLTPTPAPTGQSAQSFCGSITVADLTAEGMDIKWYATANGGVSLPKNQILVSGNHYFASQTLNYCESQERLEVTFNQETTPPSTLSSPMFLCEGIVIGSIVANTNWYAAPTGGTKLWNSTKVVDGNTYYAAQLGTCGESPVRKAVVMNLKKTPPPVAASNETWISFGGGHGDSEAIRSDGTAWIWGGGYVNSGVTYHYTPRQNGSDNTWVKTFYGGNRSIRLKADGGIYLTPGISRIGTENDWASAAIYGSGSEYHAAAIKTDGTLWAWGNTNTYGQIGDGTYAAKVNPVKIGMSSDWKSVFTGYRFTVALKNDGTIWAWGNNGSGQLGDGTLTKKNVPTRIGTDSDWKFIAAGGQNGMAIKNDATLWAWGYNNFGNLGDGTTTLKKMPTKIGLETWQTVSPGDMHSLGISTDGTLWAWGYGSSGALGQGRWQSGHSYVPKQVGVQNNWKAAVAAAAYSMALTDDGVLWTWGSNDSGELGISVVGNRPDARPISAKQFTCANTVTLAQLPVTGENIKWYNTNGQLVPNTFTLSHQQHFYATQTIDGIESCHKLDIVGDNGFPLAPTGPPSQTFCDAAIVANMVPTHSGISWYENATGGVKYSPAEVLYDGREYYASQTIGGCESANRLKVKVTVKAQTSPEGPAEQSFCGGARVENLVPSGGNIRWFEIPTGGEPLLPTTRLLDGTPYYASEITGVCESANRLKVKVTVNAQTLPEGPAEQSFCGGARVENLVPSGGNIRWFETPTGGEPLLPTIRLIAGTPYYASEITGVCESQERLKVLASVNDPASPTGEIIQTLCASSRILDLVVLEPIIHWYATPTGGLRLSDTTMLEDNAIYYAAQVVGECQSATRLGITAKLIVTPAPTADNIQSFASGQTVKELAVDGEGIKWYSTTYDAANRTNVLTGNELLLNDLTYYATQTLNGCESPAALMVQVSIVLGVESPKSRFEFYPNPVREYLNIHHTHIIDHATVFTITGQPLISQRVDSRDAKLNLSSLANGLYLVQLTVGKGNLMLKVIKQ